MIGTKDGGRSSEPQRIEQAGYPGHMAVVDTLRTQALCTFITSQYPVFKWHDRIGEPTMADAILDRIVHNAHKIALKGNGESMRKTRSTLTHREH